MRQLRVTTEHVQAARAIAKKHGIKHCKKGTAKSAPIYIGRQCIHVNQRTGNMLVDDLTAAGFSVAGHSTESLRLDIADVFTVYPVA